MSHYFVFVALNRGKQFHFQMSLHEALEQLTGEVDEVGTLSKWIHNVSKHINVTLQNSTWKWYPKIQHPLCSDG